MMPVADRAAFFMVPYIDNCNEQQGTKCVLKYTFGYFKGKVVPLQA
jgi:hypothetical protein